MEQFNIKTIKWYNMLELEYIIKDKFIKIIKFHFFKKGINFKGNKYII